MVTIDVSSTMQEYLDRTDWRVNANANQGYSLGGLILNTAGKVTANYWLSEVYPEAVGAAHRSGDLHIHDLDVFGGYCAGWSLRMLLTQGFNGVPGRVESNPPKHLSSAMGQIVNFLGTMQNEWAGAQAFSSFDTYMAAFVRKDDVPYDDVKQAVQELIYNLNVPSRWGTQTPFTNLTFDWTCPADLKDEVPIIADEAMDFTYGDLQIEMDMINQAYIEVMTEGDASGRVFTFPIPTYNITEDFPWESPNAARLFEMTAKYGLPYFQNFLSSELEPGMVRSMCCRLQLDLRELLKRGNGLFGSAEQTGSIGVVTNFLSSELEPGMVRSMCCRLQLDLRELLKRGNGLFGSAEQTGSIGVVTINCARLGYLHKGDEPALLAALDTLLDLAKDSLELKREVVQHYIDEGLFPYTRRYLGTLDNHFSTIGLGYLHPDDEAGLIAALDRLLAIGRDTLELKREVIGHHIEAGLFPFTKRYLGSLDNHFSTLGVNGMNEMVRNFTRNHDDGGSVLRRLRPAPLHERAHLLCHRLQGARAPVPDGLPHPLHHRHPHLLHLPHPRLPRG